MRAAKDSTVTVRRFLASWGIDPIPSLPSSPAAAATTTTITTTTTRPTNSGSVNEYQLRLGRQRKVWFIPSADEREGVQVKL